MNLNVKGLVVVDVLFVACVPSLDAGNARQSRRDEEMIKLVYTACKYNQSKKSTQRPKEDSSLVTNTYQHMNT